MDWTKVPTDLIIDRRTDNEITAIVKYQLLWAFFEEEPSMEKALRYMTKKQYKLATSYKDSIKKCVTSDILHVIKKRGSEKKRYNKNKDLDKILDARQDNGLDTNLDTQIREDKIREDKIKENKINNIQDGPLDIKNTGKYKFNGKVIKLNKKDYNAWRDEFTMIDIQKELTSLDNWYFEHKVKDWFFRCKTELKKRHLEKCPRRLDGSIIEHPFPYL